MSEKSWIHILQSYACSSQSYVFTWHARTSENGRKTSLKIIFASDCYTIAHNVIFSAHKGSWNIVESRLWLHKCWYQRKKNTSLVSALMLSAAPAHLSLVLPWWIQAGYCVSQRNKSWCKSVHLCHRFQMGSVLPVHIRPQQLHLQPETGSATDQNYLFSGQGCVNAQCNGQGLHIWIVRPPHLFNVPAPLILSPSPCVAVSGNWRQLHILFECPDWDGSGEILFGFHFNTLSVQWGFDLIWKHCVCLCVYVRFFCPVNLDTDRNVEKK